MQNNWKLGKSAALPSGDWKPVKQFIHFEYATMNYDAPQLSQEPPPATPKAKAAIVKIAKIASSKKPKN